MITIIVFASTSFIAGALKTLKMPTFHNFISNLLLYTTVITNFQWQEALFIYTGRIHILDITNIFNIRAYRSWTHIKTKEPWFIYFNSIILAWFWLMLHLQLHKHIFNLIKKTCLCKRLYSNVCILLYSIYERAYI